MNSAQVQVSEESLLSPHSRPRKYFARIKALEASAAGSVHEDERNNNRHNDQEIAFGVSDLICRSAEDAADAHSDPKKNEERHDQLKDVEIKNHAKTLQEVVNKDRPF
jgi:hypothetical protein